jgi:hypothetical protein
MTLGLPVVAFCPWGRPRLEEEHGSTALWEVQQEISKLRLNLEGSTSDVKEQLRARPNTAAICDLEEEHIVPGVREALEDSQASATIEIGDVLLHLDALQASTTFAVNRCIAVF